MQPERLTLLARTERIGHAVGHFARDQGLRLLLTALATVIVVRLVRYVLYRVRRRAEASSLATRGPEDPGRIRALLDVLNYLAVALVVIIGVLGALSVVAGNTRALLASAGLLGLAVGVRAQTMGQGLA